MSDKSVVIHVRIPFWIKEAIERIAKELGLTPSAIYRLGLGLFVMIWNKFGTTHSLKAMLNKLTEDE